MEWCQHWLLAFSKMQNIPQFQRIHEMLIGTHTITVLSGRGLIYAICEKGDWKEYDCSWIQKEIYDQCFPPMSSCLSDSYNDARAKRDEWHLPERLVFAENWSSDRRVMWTGPFQEDIVAGEQGLSGGAVTADWV